MNAFNEMNTEGFNASELETLNNALATLQDRFPGVEENNLIDLLNNKFAPGITEEEIIESVSKILS